MHDLGDLCSVACTRHDDFVETSGLVSREPLPHLLRPATRRVDQMMLALAAAQPGALCHAARRETAAVERDGRLA